ncbi:MAG: gamma-glutamyltransferase [Microcoleaceae cyanobacterium]
MPFVRIAAGSQIAADAGAAIADQGGNAVDAAIAATLVAMSTDIAVIAPGCSGFITIWPPNALPVVIDAYAEMPGRGLGDWGMIANRLATSTQRVEIGYGGGMETWVGYGSVATPGMLAGLSRVSEGYGSLSWSAVMQPAIRWAEQGSSLPEVAAEYLAYSHQEIFGWHPDSHQTLHHADGRPLTTGETVHIPGLATTLQQIADQGVAAFYTGTLAERIAHEIQAHGGLLTLMDLATYQAIPRQPLRISYQNWEIVTNPPPAVGGACLAAMLLLIDQHPLKSWNADTVDQWIQIQSGVLDYRSQHLDQSNDNTQAALQLLEWAGLGSAQHGVKSPSTIHISAVDSQGLACSISASAGYGSGAMISGTGLWLNNSLGELELHPQGLEHFPPGTRLVSNMAPTIARRADGAVLAIGSPGASRITTAIAQVLFNTLQLGIPLSEAIAQPRLHVEVLAGTKTVALEPGLSTGSQTQVAVRRFPQLSMYFGGVQAVLWHPDSGLRAAADLRRAGGVAQGGG